LIDATVTRKARELGVTLRPARGRVARPELGVDYSELASLREQPTETPRDPAVFRYKKMAQLSATITELSDEIGRLNKIYSDEIAHLNKVIERLSPQKAHLKQLFPVRMMLAMRKLGKGLMRGPGSRQP